MSAQLTHVLIYLLFLLKLYVFLLYLFIYWITVGLCFTNKPCHQLGFAKCD